MSIKILNESGMNFYYDTNETFLCEQFLKKVNIKYIKSVEFIRLYNNYIVLIEAKTSAPNPYSNHPEDFKNFIESLSQKAIDSFSLFMSLLLHRREGYIEGKIGSIDYSNAKFRFFVVIKNHEDDWCIQIKEALEETMWHFTNAWDWGPQPILVLNEEMAREIGLIAPPEQTKQ